MIRVADVFKEPWQDVEAGNERDVPAPTTVTEEPTPPPREPGEPLWRYMHRRAVWMGLKVTPEPHAQPAGPPRPRQVKPYLERLHEIYRRDPREPGEEG